MDDEQGEGAGGLSDGDAALLAFLGGEDLTSSRPAVIATEPPHEPAPEGVGLSATALGAAALVVDAPLYELTDEPTPPEPVADVPPAGAEAPLLVVDATPEPADLTVEEPLLVVDATPEPGDLTVEEPLLVVDATPEPADLTVEEPLLVVDATPEPLDLTVEEPLLVVGAQVTGFTGLPPIPGVDERLYGGVAEVGPPEATPEERRRRIGLWVGVGTLLLAVMIGVAFLVAPGEPPLVKTGLPTTPGAPGGGESPTTTCAPAAATPSGHRRGPVQAEPVVLRKPGGEPGKPTTTAPPTTAPPPPPPTTAAPPAPTTAAPAPVTTAAPRPAPAPTTTLVGAQPAPLVDGGAAVPAAPGDAGSPPVAESVPGEVPPPASPAPC